MPSGLLLRLAIMEAIAWGYPKIVSLVQAGCYTAASHLPDLWDIALYTSWDWCPFPASQRPWQRAAKIMLQMCAVANKADNQSTC